MSETSIVFGRIEIDGEDCVKEAKDNLVIIEQLPSQSEAGFRYLTREMCNSNLLPGKGNVTIAFGRSYKNAEHSWDHWIEAFEFFLTTIKWGSVNVILETEMFGTHQYMWFNKYYWTGTPRLTKDLIENHELTEFENWYFGKGFRDFWGYQGEWGHNNEDK
jgi:hypothetical protein